MIAAINRSVSRKFVVAVMATTFLTLLAMAAALLAYDIASFRDAWVNDLTTQADIIANVSAPALAFNDAKAARENLEQVRVRPAIRVAVIRTSGGELFAQYSRDGRVPAAPPVPSGGFAVEGNEITVVRDIKGADETLGTVALVAEYPLQSRIGSYVAILAAVTLACLVFATLVAIQLQKGITDPIRDLTAVVGHVVERRDFSARVVKTTDDEIGALVDSFNSMLREVGDRSRALEASNQALQHETGERRDAEDAVRLLNNTLEERIVARTAELEHAHEQLRQAQKMEAIGQLTGGIAHDFNNMLQAISGSLQLIQRKVERNQISAIGAHVGSARQAVDRAAALTNRLLAFARRQALQPRGVDADQLIRGVADLIRRTVGPAIAVDLKLGGGVWHVVCDPNQLENALLNVAINARDAMPDGGRLIIETADRSLTGPDAASTDYGRPGDYVEIAVTDTGTGMDEATRARVFEPFFTTKPIGRGTGLGLSQVYGFVRQSGGIVHVESVLSVGTTVRLQLPRQASEAGAEAAAPHAAETMASANARGVVLLVEDELDARDAMAEWLDEQGYEVVVADDGPTALRRLETTVHLDLLITDVGLPNGLNGRQVAEAARQRWHNLPVLFITGYAGSALEEDLDANMKVLPKPFALDVLSGVIAGILSERSYVL